MFQLKKKKTEQNLLKVWGLTGLRAGTAPRSTVEEVGLADVAPLLLLVVVVALPPPAVVDVTVVVVLFGLAVVLAGLGRDKEGTFGMAPVLEPSLAGFTADLAEVTVDP